MVTVRGCHRLVASNTTLPAHRPQPACRWIAAREPVSHRKRGSETVKLSAPSSRKAALGWAVTSRSLPSLPWPSSRRPRRGMPRTGAPGGTTTYRTPSAASFPGVSGASSRARPAPTPDAVAEYPPCTCLRCSGWKNSSVCTPSSVACSTGYSATTPGASDASRAYVAGVRRSLSVVGRCPATSTATSALTAKSTAVRRLAEPPRTSAASPIAASTQSPSITRITKRESTR